MSSFICSFYDNQGVKMSFEGNNLKVIANVCAEKIRKAIPDKQFFDLPFEHVVIDDFFPEELANICLENFPPLSDPSWHHSNDKNIEVKYRTTWESEFDIPEGIVDAVKILNSSMVLLAMSDLMGIEKIIPDSYYKGGGLNVTKRGGLLDVHVDGNYHDATGLNRRLNAILYLNPNYQTEWGGEFGIYDETGDNCVKKIEPLFNRLIIFNTHDKSFHGLPDPVNFPKNELRRSIILYYYTKEERRGAETVVSEPHSALWKKKGVTDKKGKKTRSFT
jgi:Rps23 Pro-64 3,4-dihydroxylase Tpa1-like proline 4-hydroxylase